MGEEQETPKKTSTTQLKVKTTTVPYGGRHMVARTTTLARNVWVTILKGKGDDLGGMCVVFERLKVLIHFSSKQRTKTTVPYGERHLTCTNNGGLTQGTNKRISSGMFFARVKQNEGGMTNHRPFRLCFPKPHACVEIPPILGA